ncbi:hypothetical protein EDD22DRAFT_959090 [Suillus occidentalis]|nr:hypothetical protein EDD22DRAFT_959090 [Suillus occidentalis]
MSDLQQVIALLNSLQTQMETSQADLQRDIKDVARDVTSLRRDLDEKTHSLHNDIAILGQDVQRDVTLLRRDVTSLQQDVASLKRNVASLPEDLTLKQAMVHNLDHLSDQFMNVIGNFKELAETIYSNFDTWAKTAHSRVIDKVLEIQRPRLKAIENKLHNNAPRTCQCLHNNPSTSNPTSIPVATTQQCSRPCLCVRKSDETESEDVSSDDDENSLLSIETASSSGNGTFGSHQMSPDA